MDDGYLALMISIFRNVTPDTAFRMLSGDERWTKNRHWTCDDVENIENMRKDGMTWAEIGKDYGISSSAAYKMYYYNKKKIERSH